MAAVAQQHLREHSWAQHSRRMADSTPSFTAVNGTASPAPQPSTTTDGSTHTKSTEENNHPSQPSSNPQESARAPAPSSMDTQNSDVRPQKRSSPAPPLASASAPHPSAALAPAQQTSSTLSHNRPNPPTSQHNVTNEESRPQSVANHPSSGNTQQTSAATMSSQKRKRSPSGDRESTSNPIYGPIEEPRSPGAPRASNGVENSRPGETYSPQHAYPPPQDIYQQPSTESYPPPHAYPPPPDQRGGHADIFSRSNGLARNEYDPPLDPSIAPSQERPYYSESHLAEALQRENRNYDAMPGRENYVSPEDDEEQHGQYTTYGGSRDRDSQPVSEMDRKRRKRVFSNRTKTGCMTCRRRKKKCDEQHPECKSLTPLPLPTHHVHGRLLLESGPRTRACYLLRTPFL